MSDAEPDHVEANVQRLAELHAQQASGASAIQQVVMAATSVLGRASSVAVVLGLLVVWGGYNLAAPHLGLVVFDPWPFPVLSVTASVVALFTTLLIMATQRREEALARKRAQLTLNLVALSEQKIAKVIDLLEEQRRENPMLPIRNDDEARQMARASDPGHVLDRIIETHEGAERS